MFSLLLVKTSLGAARRDAMLLYDNERTSYVSDAVRAFAPLVSPDTSALGRHNLIRSFDSMSYIKGIDEFITRDIDALEAAKSKKNGQKHEERVVDFLKQGPGPNVCDIGAGYGWFSRSLNFRGLNVTAVEYDKETAQVARSLDDYVAQNGPRVHFWDDPEAKVNDGVKYLNTHSCDAVVSILAFLHIPENLIFDALQRGVSEHGRLYVEDFVAIPSAVKQDPRFAEKVRRVVWMPTLRSQAEYEAALKDDFEPVGSQLIYDVGETWKKFVLDRWKKFGKVNESAYFCLGSDTAVIPDVSRTSPAPNCKKLGDFMPSAKSYLASQGEFVCSVCELFHGVDAHNAPCGCLKKKGWFEHPQLVSGIYVAAQRASPTRIL